MTADSVGNCLNYNSNNRNKETRDSLSSNQTYQQSLTIQGIHAPAYEDGGNDCNDNVLEDTSI